MKRVFALLVLITAVAACNPVATQPQITVTLRPTAAPEAATAEATVEATESPLIETTVEATEVAAADVVLVVDAALTGDVALGEDLFLHGRNGAVPCSGCHNNDSDARLVGPGLLTVAERAATRSADQTAVEYLHESIVDPGALVVAGYFNMMPKDFGALYSQAEIDALVAYLLSLNAPQTVADAGAAG